ncbi:MAG: DUF11 domain-containing protein, partial [Pedobacter sp.]
FNGIKIEGANSNTYVARSSGNYTVTSNLECGMSAQSLPLIVSLCNIDRSVEKSVDKAFPDLGEVVNFKIIAKNLSSGNAIGVSVSDKLPSGYEYVSHNTTFGSYSSSSGLWSIGEMNGGTTFELNIQAKVVISGQHTNVATITGTQQDNNTSNDQAEVSTKTELGTVTLISIGSADRVICVNNEIEDIVYKIGGGATGAIVNGLPSGISYSYVPASQLIIITGKPNSPTSITGLVYTVTTQGGIPVSKTGLIQVKANVGIPVFTPGLSAQRCAGENEELYSASAENSESILYQLFPSTAGSINETTGSVKWSAEFTGEATILAKAMGCIEQESSFKIMVNALPPVPIVADLAYCQNQSGIPALSATSVSGATLLWYD